MNLMEITQITSSQNPTIKEFSTFNRRKTPDLIMLDGPHLHTEYFRATEQTPTQILVSDSFIASSEFSQFATWPNLIQVPRDLLSKLSPSKSPSGILSLAKKPLLKTLSKTSLTLILENIQDPGNVGSMLRTANAMNAGQVLFLGSGADVWSAKCLRAGMGAQFHLPCQAIEDLAQWKTDFNGVLAGTSLQGDDLWESPLPAPLALVFGNEGQGVTPQTQALCDQNLKIPMNQNTESLNVASSLAILTHEFARQHAL